MNVVFKLEDALEVDACAILEIPNGVGGEKTYGWVKFNKDGTSTFFPNGLYFKK